MTDIDRLEERLAALERTIADESRDRVVLGEDSAREVAVERIESRLDALDRRVADLESTVQSIDGYVSRIQSVNRDVERQADSAIATVDRLETRLETVEKTASDTAARLDVFQTHDVPTQDTAAARQQSEKSAAESDTHNRTHADVVIDTGDEASTDPDSERRGFVAAIRDGMAQLRERIT